MASSEHDLSQLFPIESEYLGKLQVGIVRSEWNEEITRSLMEGVRATLKYYDIPDDHIHEIDVPGSFELTYGASLLIKSYALDAVVCLGCVIKGETKHDEYISNAVSNGITQLSVNTGIPVVFGVLTPNNMEQAKARAGGKYGNKGVEAGYTAVRMAILRKENLSHPHKIGF